MSDRSVLVLHGSYGSPFGNWFGWLSSGLTERQIRCYVPPLPTPLGQSYDNWAKIVDAYIDTGCINHASTVVAHSSGCPFIVRHIAQRGQSLEHLVTVSGFDQFLSGDPDFDEINARIFTRAETDFELVRKLVVKRTSYLSLDDPHLPVEVMRSFGQKLGAEVIEFDAAGHFNSDSGFVEFPDLLTRLTRG